MQLDPSQERAVALMLCAPFSIVTGGPGTGKSTTLRTALTKLLGEGKRVALAAPTGKAARRMSEATGGYEASTIHRLLGWTRDGWLYHEGNKLPYDVVIIDESSMIDVRLAADLMAALPGYARIIFVGDANQLPSVGPGRVLADLVESNAVPIARLTHVHRAAAESWICRNAPKVLAGVALELAPLPDFRFIEADSIDDVAAAVRRVVTLPEYKGAQVLSPQRTTAAGTEALNNALQGVLNPPKGPGAEWKLGETLLREGDRVIHTKNDYTLNVYNGEVGTILGVSQSEMVVDFGDRQICYSRDAAFALDLAYALTIHKCQGSEFAWVVCIVHSGHSYMLTRQLFYTAITRAKTGVILIGNQKGIAVATSAKAPPVRNTALVARMLTAESSSDAPDEIGEDEGQPDPDLWGDGEEDLHDDDDLAPELDDEDDKDIPW